jgi:hypothetical protein
MILFKGNSKEMTRKRLELEWLLKTVPMERLESVDFNLSKN